MSDPGGPPLDWDGIFQRARHHIVRRVLLVGGIAALAAVLLFSGGTASWKLVQAPNQKPHGRQTKRQINEKHDPKNSRSGRDKGSGHDKGAGHGQGGGDNPTPPKGRETGPDPWAKCRGEAAVAQEYCETKASKAAQRDS